jgi:PAS domain S-box-containing protein
VDDRDEVWGPSRREVELEAEVARLRQALGAVSGEVAHSAAGASDAILSQLAEGVIVTDPEGRIVFVNDAAARIHGAAHLGAPPEAYSEAYHLFTEDARPYPPAELPLTQAVRHGKTVTNARWRIRRPDGSAVLAVGSARPLLAPDGAQIGAVLTLRDETARDAAERALHESEGRLRALADNLPSGMIYQVAMRHDGAERRFVYVAQSCERLTGVPAEAALADPNALYGRILPEDRPALTAAEGEAIEALAPFECEARLVRAGDGEVRWCRIASAPRGLPDGTLIWDGLLVDITERRAAEAALRESEALKGAILDAALDCIVTIDHESRVLEWNPAAERTFGHAREAVLGRDMAELIIPPEHREGHRRGLARYLATGEGPLLGRRIEVEAQRADGSRFPAELAITPTSVSSRTLFTAHLRDVTKPKAAEAALADSEARFRAVADNIPQLAWMAEPDGRRRWYNRRWYDYTGQTVEEARDWGWRKVHHSDHLERVLARMQHALEAGEPWEDIFPLRGRNGGYRWYLSRAVPVLGTGGRVALWFGTNTDITEQREAEAALTASEAEFRAIFETAAAGVTEVDPRTGRYLRVNRRFCEIVGRTEGELLGDRLGPDDISHPDDRGVNAATLAAAAASGRYEAEKRYLRPDGTVVWVRASAAVAARDAAGGATRTVAVVQDITERKRAERQQALLVAELNHRVKNTLSTVQAVADQTLRGAGGDLRRFTRDFTARLQVLARAHDLLTARGWEATGLGEVSSAALAPWLPQGGKDGRIHLDLRGAAGAAVSPRQAQALVLALHELATNATKYGALSLPRGRVEVRCEAAADGAFLVLQWTETGGPRVAGPPMRLGFGTRLLERGLAQDLGSGSSVVLHFDPGGLRASIRFAPAGS